MKRVIIGLSGGVDSSVSAWLLKQQGYQVEGILMKNWEQDDDEFCSIEQDIADAKSVCAQLDIPFSLVNFSKKYWQQVFEDFLSEYQAGRTPNPDILCNREIKFKAFLDHAMNIGADYIAMGHYAGIKQIEDQFYLTKAIDHTKDQTYFLYTLNQQQLAKSIFPLAQWQKKEVRQKALELGLVNSTKKDSTGICFIGERNFKHFLKEYLLPKPGDILDIDSQKKLGQHEGLMYHTIGQRQGLHIGGKNFGSGLPWYVVNKDLEKNILWVAQGHNHLALFHEGLWCEEIHWINPPPILPFKCLAKTRYRHEAQACIVEKTDRFKVTFETKQWAITPGQSIVFYQDDFCLGGGVIQNRF